MEIIQIAHEVYTTEYKYLYISLYYYNIRWYNMTKCKKCENVIEEVGGCIPSAETIEEYHNLCSVCITKMVKEHTKERKAKRELLGVMNEIARQELS